MSEYTGHQRALLAGKGRGPGLDGAHDHVRLDRPGRGAHQRRAPRTAGDDVDDLGVLVDGDAPAFDRVRQAAGEERRLERGAVRGERGAEHPIEPDQRGGFAGIEPAQVLFPETQRTGLLHVGQGPGSLGRGPRGIDRAALGELTVDALFVCCGARPRPPWTAWRVACAAWRRGRRAGRARYRRWRTAPSTTHRCDPRRRTRPPPCPPPRCGAPGRPAPSACAVHSPVNPAPTMQTSAWRSPDRAGRGGSGPAMASHQRERWR